jgi:PKD repeat protein
VSWHWDFGDGATSTEQHPTHTYSSAAYYDVTLTVTGASSATDFETKQVWVGVNQNPTADFAFTIDGLTVIFTDQSSDTDGTIESWSWDFGDGSTSTEQNPSHTYASAGTFTVTLTVTDNNGLTDPVSKDVTVSDGGGVPDYCPSSSSSADNMAISQVEIGSFTNTSGKSTYSDFTGMTINMQAGQSYNTAITMDNSGYNARVVIWIDFNRDGVFDDETEQVFRQHRKGTVTGTITIPASGVVTGQKLGLRIHADTFSYQDPCDVNVGYGEVEDYAVIIQ